jgi:uncharacterized surface protein with fasciclin (FAS1) repeats
LVLPKPPKQQFIYSLKSLIMKKFCLATSMVVMSFVCVQAQEKMATSTEKAAVSSATTKPAKAAATNAMASTSQAGTVADIIAGSKDHSTLLAALKAAGLEEALKGAGPFTVLAPTNDAFAAVPKADVENLMKPEGKEALTKVLSGHVIMGSNKSTDILATIKAGGGTAVLTTLSGEKITATEEGGKIKLTSASGKSATVTSGDLSADNGVVHVISGVL